jgi:transposase
MASDDSKENLDKHIQKLERANKNLKEELEKERSKRKNLEKENKDLKEEKEIFKKENKNLKEQLAKLMSSAPLLAASDRTAEAGGVPTSKVFYRRNRVEGKKRPTGGQPGHIGHGRKSPIPNAPPVRVTLIICPNCSNPVRNKAKGAEQHRTITDIPLPTHIVYEVIYHRYWCKTCKKFVRGEVVWIPPNQQFGPAVACWIAYQRMLGLTIGKIKMALYETYGLEMSEGTILKLEKWVADKLQDDYDKLQKEVIKASAVNADETRFRIGGGNGWLWVFTHTLGSLYVVAPTRGHKVPEETLKGFNGVLGRDAWKPYDVVKCSGHQLDLLHVNRWLERAEIRHCVEPRTLLSSRPVKLKRRGRPPEKFLEFVNGVRSILKRAVEFSDKDPPLSTEERGIACIKFKNEMKALLSKERKDKDAIIISKELRKRLDMLFTFVEKEGVSWHNNDAERAIRKGVLARKISGGRRTWGGAKIFQVLLSTYETTKKKGMNFIELAKKRLCTRSSNDIHESGVSKS